MRRRRAIRPVLLALLGTALFGLGAMADAAEPATRAARDAVELCRLGARPGTDSPQLLWDRGIALAEEAIAESPDDPVAHFALFCNLGRLAQSQGFSLSVLRVVRRLQEHIDLALRLDPQYPDALAGKAGMLIALPRLLGGDLREAERLLRAALERDPGNVETRALLRDLLARDGRGAEADHPGTAMAAAR